MSIYSQNILEHYKYPQNKCEMISPDHTCENTNRSCWDSIVVYLKIEWDKINEIKFTWNWCAISMATASILSEELIWMTKEEILKLKLEDIEELIQVKIWANRIKCALLAISAIQECLKK